MKTQKLILSLLFGLAIFSPGAIYSATCQPLSILYPLYSYPPEIWDDIAAKNTSGNIIAITNSNNGPGETSPDSNYIVGMNLLQNASIQMIGYVSTSYSNRDINLVKKDIDRWSDSSYNSWISGIFLDEVSTNYDYYANLSAYIRTKFLGGLIASNPGVQSPPSFSSLFDIRNVFEDSYASWLTSSVTGNANSSAIIYQTPNLPQMIEAVQLASNRGFGYIFVTHDTLPNPFDDLPLYWNRFVAQTNNPCANPSPTSTGTLPPPNTPTPPGPLSCPKGNLGNLNCDPEGIINGIDWEILLSKWTTTGPVPSPATGQHPADIVIDGKINSSDLAKLLTYWTI